MSLVMQDVAPIRDVLMPPKGRWMVFLDPPEETLGQIIRRLRLAKGLSQKQLAEKIGLSDEHQALMSAYERGAVPPDDVLREMETFFELRRGELDGPAFRAVQSRRASRATKPVIKERAIAIRDEPGLPQVIEEVIELDPEKFDEAAEALRRIRSGEDVSSDLQRLARVLDQFLSDRPAEERDETKRKLLAFWKDTERQQ